MTSAVSKARRAMIVAGESSGDLHGSNLLKAAAEIDPELHFFGVGGERMTAAGCEILFPSDELSVMGLVEVVGQLPRLLSRFRQLKQTLQGADKPELLILIDFPDFNLRLAKVAKQAGVPVLYYISPKVWAWRKGRAKTIAERVDRLALIFPFEKDIYAPLGVTAEYVGNPLLDEFAANPPRGSLRKQLAVADDEQLVGIFPGSRQSELKYIFPTLLATAKLLAQAKPQLRFVLPVAPSLDRDDFERQVAESGLPISIVEENIYEVAAACDAVLSVSGTVTLQITLVGTPLAILYKVAPLSYQIGKRLIKIPFAGLTNIVAGRGIVKEFIQDAANPSALCAEVLRLLNDPEYSEEMKKNLQQVRQLLGEPGCSRRVAQMASEMSLQKVGN